MIFSVWGRNFCMFSFFVSPQKKEILSRSLSRRLFACEIKLGHPLRENEQTEEELIFTKDFPSNH